MIDHDPVTEKITIGITIFPPFSPGASKEDITISIPGGLTVRDLVMRMVAAHEGFRRHLGQAPDDEQIQLHAMILQNGRMVGLDQPIHAGDHFKFLLPIQGG